MSYSLPVVLLATLPNSPNSMATPTSQVAAACQLLVSATAVVPSFLTSCQENAESKAPAPQRRFRP